MTVIFILSIILPFWVGRHIPPRKRMTKELHLEKRSGARDIDRRIQVQLEEDGGVSIEQR